VLLLWLAVDALRSVGRVVLSLEPGGLDGVDVTKLLVTCRAGCGATEPESLKLDCLDLES
jgi:hypothetical protein